jgi:hypothetical protein
MAAGSMRNLITTGFGVGLGAFAALMVYIVIGLIFFVPGFILYKQSQRRGETDSAERIFSVILMGIGVVVMGGVGLGMLMENVGDMF